MSKTKSTKIDKDRIVLFNLKWPHSFREEVRRAAKQANRSMNSYVRMAVAKQMEEDHTERLENKSKKVR